MFNNSNNRITVYKQKVVRLIGVTGNLRYSRVLSNTVLNKKKSLIFFQLYRTGRLLFSLLMTNLFE